MFTIYLLMRLSCKKTPFLKDVFHATWNVWVEIPKPGKSERKGSNLRLGHKPLLYLLSYVPRGKQQAFTCCLVGFDVSRRPYAFGFMVHYNTLFRNMCNNRNKLYFSSINLKYSIFTPASVAFLPILSATRSEERRVGKECSEPCRSRWSPYH